MLLLSRPSSSLLSPTTPPTRIAPSRRGGDGGIILPVSKQRVGKMKPGAAAGCWLDFPGQLRVFPCLSTGTPPLRHSVTPVRPQAGPPRRSTPGLSVDWVNAGRDAFFNFLIMFHVARILSVIHPLRNLTTNTVINKASILIYF